VRAVARQSNPGSRTAVLRRAEPTRFSSASDDEVGGFQSAIRTSDVRAAALQEERTKRRQREVTLHQEFRRIRRRRRLPGEHRSERSEQLDTASLASEAINTCPRWDSNPCWSGFKPPASAIWATGASHPTAGVILARVGFSVTSPLWESRTPRSVGFWFPTAVALGPQSLCGRR
jgi:hypothetical protein